MPKTPKKETSLRKLRLATGMTQKEFAEFLGINFDAYQSKELGRAPVSWFEQVKIMRCTGVHPLSLDPKSDGPRPISDPLGFYTEKTWNEWRASGLPAKQSAQGLVKQIASWLEILFEAADKINVADQVFMGLCRSINQLRGDYGLQAETNRILQKRKTTAAYKLKVGTLRKNPKLLRSFGLTEKAIALKFDEDEVEVQNEITHPWSPEVIPAPPPPSSASSASQSSRRKG